MEKTTMGSTSLDVQLAKTLYEAREEEIQRYLLEREALRLLPARSPGERWASFWAAGSGWLVRWFKPTPLLTQATGLGQSRRS
jgi:hypothetical protein